MVPIDLLHTQHLMAFGRMAVTAVLVVIGVQASFSIMFFGGVDSPSAWGPGLALTSGALIYLLFAPVTPLRNRLQNAKAEALVALNEKLRNNHSIDALDTPAATTELGHLLTVRDELRRVPEWPFDMDLLARLGIYLIIVPLTWVGAALIENLVDLVLD